MRIRKVIIYLIVPIGVSLLLNIMYFSGNIVLQRIVVPNLPPLPLQDWREFGLLENLQHLLLLAIIMTAAYGTYRKRWKWERLGFALLSLGTLFVFLEEIDYGTVYHDYLTSDHDFEWFMPRSEWSPDLLGELSQEESFSVHNQFKLTRIFKHVGDTLLVLIFGIVPLVAWRVDNRWLTYLAPDRFAVLTLIAIFVLRNITHALGDWEASIIAQAAESGVSIERELGAISKNLSEFRELNLYYLYFVHAVTLVFMRESPAERSESGRMAIPSRSRLETSSLFGSAENSEN
ncbi:MAG: hypothetical protein R6V12_03725 [Candidatus Hydrogenedentota bacterium]